MKRIIIILALLMQPVSAFAETLDLNGYLEPNGAITSGFHGDTVDPYFATKSLLTAKDGGMKMRESALSWINWALAMQRPDGLFERYSRVPGGVWNTYATADADDAVLALWLELLYRMAPAGGMPKAWQDSAAKAQAQLDSLYQADKGIYYISTAMPVGLLMDNVEIYSSLKHVAREQSRLGMDKEARATQQRAAALNKGIKQVFLQEDAGIYLVSTQDRYENSFYPDHAAQIYPMLYQLQKTAKAKAQFRDWIDINGKEWLRQRNEDYPWGLIAITALNMGDNGSASCWQNSAEPMRYGKHWNVLEETSLQLVKWHLKMRHETSIPCVGKNLL